MAARKGTRKSARSTSAAGKTSRGFTDEERVAMKDRARELKAAARGGKADGESTVLATIAAMPEPDRVLGERLHAIIKASAPTLSPRMWYGMPAYANKDGKVVLFFTPAAKFKERYATLGFNADAHLDEGSMWPTSWALTSINAADEARITELVKKAAG
jgi:uncharacterized protein YdhG (YjbR/CyaY superfamily)